METKICIFNENPITFALSKDNDMMINATEMAKVFNTEVAFFTRLDGTKKFIEACLNTAHLQDSGIKKESDLIISRQNSGTYMHRLLALKFAAWLDVDFEIWVFSVIEKLRFGKHVEREQSFERTVKLQKELNAIIEKPVKTGADFDRYLEINRELKKEKAIRKSLTKDSINEMTDLFEDDDDNE